MRIGFIGGGNMATALISSLFASRHNVDRVQVADPGATAREYLQKRWPVTCYTHAAEAIQGMDAIVLAVKPQILCDVCKPLAPVVQKTRPLIISIAAGVRGADIESWLGGDLPVVRVMPNQPALLRLGISGLCANEHTSEHQLRAATNIISTTGPVIKVASEEDIDTVTAVSGTGPAYFYLLVDMLVKAAVDLGLDYDDALALVLETARGAGEMAEQSGESMDALIARVRSPGGTTAAAFDHLDNTDFRDIFSAAVGAARDRAVNLANQAHEAGKDD